MSGFAMAFQRMEGETDDEFAERVAAALAENAGSAADPMDAEEPY